MSALDQTCNEVAFICPRPVVLVSLGKGDAGNIFPMNLMGQVGEHHFVFALNQSRKVGAAISSISELAISTIPFQHADVVRELGRNHHRSSINLRELPFRLGPSESLHIPVPEFALTVRELRVEHMVPLGSHDFFIARILTTQIRDEAPEFFRVHGLYAARR